MVNRAEIFAELTRRNAIRREAKLPLLDIRSEFDHAVSLALWKEGCAKYGDELKRLKLEELAALRQELGDGFEQSRSVGGRWAIEYSVARRFLALLASHGVHLPKPRHPIVYGSDRKAE